MLHRYSTLKSYMKPSHSPYNVCTNTHSISLSQSFSSFGVVCSLSFSRCLSGPHIIRNSLSGPCAISIYHSWPKACWSYVSSWFPLKLASHARYALILRLCLPTAWTQKLPPSIAWGHRQHLRAWSSWSRNLWQYGQEHHKVHTCCAKVDQ